MEHERMVTVVELLVRNRRRHGNAWRKVIASRLRKCFPDWTDIEFQATLAQLVQDGYVEPVDRVLDDSEIHEAIKLVGFTTKHYRRLYSTPA
jgi:hypothetical protein